MNYGALVSKSLNMMWKHKYLWILGLLASLMQGTGQTFSDVSHRSDAVGHFLLQSGILFFLILAGLFLFIIFLVLSYIAHGGLIHCVNKISRDEPTSLGDGWKTGAKNFWRLLGIGVLLFLVVIGSIVVCGAPVVIAFLVHKGLGILSLLLFVPIFLILLIIIGFVDAYADRACVIEGKGVIDSLGEGWRTFTTNLGRSIAVGIISLISGIVYAILFILLGLGLILNFLLAWALTGFIWAVVSGVMVALIYVIITEGIFNTYLSAFWTLSYLEIKRLNQKPNLSQV